MENENLLCPQCGEPCKMISSGKFRKTCGKDSCVNKEKTKRPSPFLREDVRKKAAETLEKKYGGLGAGSKIIQDKMKNTLKSRTGFESNFTSGTECREQIDKLFLSKYGGHPLTNDNVKDKIKNTLKMRYGVDNINQIQGIHDKSGESRTKNRKKLIENREKIDIVDYDGYNYKFLCQMCGSSFSYTQNVFKNRKENICPACFPRVFGGISKAQREIQEFIESLDFRCESNNRNIIHPLELDIYVPDKKLAIEYCGLYWHSELFRDKNYHFDKWKKCNDVGIKLLTIFENEWSDKKYQIKNIIRYNLLNKKSMGARKVQLKRCVDVFAAKQFLKENHLQGSAGLYYYGLYYDNELITVASFGKKRNMFGDRGSGFELVRYSTSVPVVGGLNKILQRAKMDLEFEELDSYCDLRYFTGSMYEYTGFDKIGLTIGYWYYDGKKIYHRFGFTRSKLAEYATKRGILVEDADTERSLAKKMNLVKIFDCGQVKYKKVWK